MGKRCTIALSVLLLTASLSEAQSRIQFSYERGGFRDYRQPVVLLVIHQQPASPFAYRNGPSFASYSPPIIWESRTYYGSGNGNGKTYYQSPIRLDNGYRPAYYNGGNIICPTCR